jgi:hypothetical protein
MFEELLGVHCRVNKRGFRGLCLCCKYVTRYDMEILSRPFSTVPPVFNPVHLCAWHRRICGQDDCSNDACINCCCYLAWNKMKNLLVSGKSQSVWPISGYRHSFSWEDMKKTQETIYLAGTQAILTEVFLGLLQSLLKISATLPDRSRTFPFKSSAACHSPIVLPFCAAQFSLWQHRAVTHRKKRKRENENYTKHIPASIHTLCVARCRISLCETEWYIIICLHIASEVTGFLNWPNPSSRTMSLGSTRPLTEISARNLPGG